MNLPTYAEISDRWFFLRLPQAVALEVHEAEPAARDRLRSEKAVETLRRELTTTLVSLGVAHPLPTTREGLVVVDALVTPDFVKELIEASDPDDPNNCLKLRISEFSVFLGDVAVSELGASWRYARFPNYQQSVVVAHQLELLVWDVVMKRFSSDEGRTPLADRYAAFAAAALGRRNLSRGSHAKGTG